MLYLNLWNILNLISLNSQEAIIIWLTHWGQVTYVCVSKLSITGSNNGLSPLSEPVMEYC